MKNTIRCCISCILPCGALDVVRIVHSNGRVEEIFDTVKAEEIMKLHPKHVLKKPTSSNIVIVPPDAELQRGKIYFLVPVLNAENKKKPINPSKSRSSTRGQKREFAASGGVGVGVGVGVSVDQNHQRIGCNNNDVVSISNALSDQYLSEILSDKASTMKDRRRGRVGIWRPHLESICETPLEAL